MILQALALYYQRVLQEPGAGAAFAREGFEWRRIPFVIVLDGNGRVRALQDTRLGEAGHKHGTLFLVPKGVKKTSGVSANLLWDNPSYLLGRHKPGLQKQAHKSAAQARQRQLNFIGQIRERFPRPVQDAGVKAVLSFLERGDYRQIFADGAWPEIKQYGYNLTFRLEGDACLVCQRPAVIEAVSAGSHGFPRAPELQTCLVTGASAPPVRIHSEIKGVWGSLPSGANIVSFAQDAFCSFGKKQGNNAPIGRQAEFAYTTALNMLLASPKHRFQIGDASAVIWSERASLREDVCADLFKEPARGDDPALRSLSDLLQSRNTGRDAGATRFFLLALSPNLARLSIRLWYQGTQANTARNIVQHAADCSIVHQSHQPEHNSLYQLLTSTAFLGKPEHIESQMACDTVRCILSGAEYPHSLLSAVLRRCRAERTVTYPRAALLKGILVRQTRRGKRQGEIGAGLDSANVATGYLLGRLFSLVESTQESAIPGIRHTVRDYYYGAASSRPASVFPRLVKRQSHYLGRIGNSEVASHLELQALGILGDLEYYPDSLPEPDQALFALGYYHQRLASQLSAPGDL